MPAAVVGKVASVAKTGSMDTDLARKLASAHSAGQLADLDVNTAGSSESVGGALSDWVVCGAGSLTQRKWDRLRSAVPTVSKPSYLVSSNEFILYETFHIFLLTFVTVASS